MLYGHMTRIIEAEHYDPHFFLGLQPHTKDQKIIRLWRPGAHDVYLEVNGKIAQATKIHDSGIFELSVPKTTTYKDYRVYHTNGLFAHDPYSFSPTCGDIDQYLHGKGVHYQIYNVLGAHLVTHQGIQGVKFAVWAPGAKRVSLIGDFNHWDGRINPMRALGMSGIWEIFVPGLSEGTKYKFEIKTQRNDLRIKADPYAFYSEVRPSTASVVADVDKYKWNDKEWIANRIKNRDKPQPLNIYEIHLGSWRKRHGNFLSYRESALEIAGYCKDMGYTHVELLPIAEHPLDESWGYQVSGFYAPTSRFGAPDDFQFFVDHMHANGLGVIIDWVPGHFPTDDFSLGKFDGTSLYEHEDPRQGFHPHWGTLIFNFGRHEVSNFLIANALYWCDKMHVDGLRVDAVASMLYLDYGRESGEWIPNQYGGKENLEAVEFFKHLNSIVHQNYPGVLTIAEESTSFTGITHPVEQGGLGFDMKWNMGWMNDTLRYFSKDSFYRHYHHHDLTFGLLYAFSEKFVLVLSHDEVVHGKNSLLGRMSGDIWQKFANLRLLFSYMMCQPGKKLVFMGDEFGQWNEWYCKVELDWNLLDFSTHRGVQSMVRDLNHFYLHHTCLWERDFDYRGFAWVGFDDYQNSVISYLRKGEQYQFLCVHNFTPTYHHEYMIRLENISSIQEVFNTDAEKYGGSGKSNPFVHIIKNDHGYPTAIKISLAPLATMIFDVRFN